MSDRTIIVSPEFREALVGPSPLGIPLSELNSEYIMALAQRRPRNPTKRTQDANG